MRNSERVLNSLAIHSRQPNYKFERLYRLLFNEQMYYAAYQRIYAKEGNMTKGADNATIDHMSISRIEKLIISLKDESYQPIPSRRVYIPKKNGKKRPLGIPTFNDKLLQEVVRMILEAIYEPVFDSHSHGFRPGKSCHTALRQISSDFTGVVWFIEGDIQGCFDNINHEKLIEILSRKIKDSRFLNIIRQFLKAGYIENWKYNATYSGSPQGGICSPILANIYMYYSIILWFEKIKKQSKGYMEIINYADDIVMCFQYKDEAEETYRKMKDRLKLCGLEFAEDKTKLIEFGRFAKENRKRKGLGKPETFDFLGFTHYCSESKKTGKFRVKRKTSKKKLKKAISEFKTWIKENRNKKLNDIIVSVKKKLTGHYNYYGITDNIDSNARYYYSVYRELYKWLNRRSQKKSYTEETFKQMIEVFNLPKPKIKVNIYAI